VFSDAHGQQQERHSKQVVLALDAPSAHELLLNSPSTAAAAATLRFPEGVPTLIVRLWFRSMPRPIAPSGICTGDFLVDNFFWLDQIQPIYQQWHQATGGSAVEMHVYGPSEVLAQPDATLLARVVHDTYRAFPELRGSLLHAAIERNAATHTLFTPGDPARSLAVQTPWPGMVACGDWINDPNPAMYLERATTTGMVAANRVLCDFGLEPWPIAAHPEPEWFAGKLSNALTRFRLATTQRRRARQRSS
jgi:isorenieratene synthase